jgi:RNase P subunit RPR2
MIKKRCENCGGIIIYPKNKRVVYRSEVEGWVCDDCLIPLLRQKKDFVKELKEKNEKNNNNK